MYRIHYVDTSRKQGLAIVFARSEEDARLIFWESAKDSIAQIQKVVLMPLGSIYWID